MYGDKMAVVWLCCFTCCFVYAGLRNADGDYTAVNGWMIGCFVRFLTGTFHGLWGEAVSGVSGDMLTNPREKRL